MATNTTGERYLETRECEIFLVHMPGFSIKLTGIRRVTAKVEAADVASSRAPLMAIEPLPKVLGLKALTVLALLAPSVAKADRSTAVDLDELAPSHHRANERARRNPTYSMYDQRDKS